MAAQETQSAVSASKYPVSEKLNQIAAERQKIENFLDFLDDQGISIVKYAWDADPDYTTPDMLSSDGDQMSALILKFLGIDATALEQERRQMLADLV